MAVETGLIKQAYGITFTVRTANAADWAAVANDTTFYDIDTDKIYYKSSTGIVRDRLKSFEYEVNFVEVEQVLQLFREASSITGINTANVDSLAYDINETGSFTTLTLPGDLPLAIGAGNTVTWQIAYSAGKDKASINIVGTEV